MARVIDDISPIELRRLFSYDPKTGVVRRKTESRGTPRIGSVVGAMCGKGYLRVTINKRLYQLHRIVFAIIHDRWPTEHVDHINGNKSDNRAGNLREASNAENMRAVPPKKSNRSGASGVMWDRARGQWRAQIKVNYRLINLGRFSTKDAALAARQKAERQYFGEFAPRAS